MNWESICHQVSKLAIETGKYIYSNKNSNQAKQVEEKTYNNFVTQIDKTAEQKIVDGLTKIFPQAGFLAEEGTGILKDEWNWIIDPLDGTTNFMNGIPIFAVSIALRNQEETIVGVVYEANLDECFYSWKGSKAYLNKQEISVSKAKILQDSLLATGFPYDDFSRAEPYLKMFYDLIQHSRGIRRLGSAATDLAYVACGRFSGFYEYGLNPWDVAAGAFIVEQAGGKVTDFSNGNNYLFGEEIVATNNSIHTEFIETIKKYFE